MLDSAPDLQLGFNVGYGASDECAIGGITGEGVLANNDSRWSGSHLMDPDLVKGTLVIRGQSKVELTPSLEDITPSLEDITATLYNLFSVQGPAGLDGQSLLNP
jgi:hypothetical protein